MKALKLSLVFGILCLTLSSSDAAVFNWLGGNGVWNDGNNWDLGTVPTESDGVIISSGTVFIYDSAEANYIHLNGGNLEVHGSLYMEPDIPWYGINTVVRGIMIESSSSFDNYGKTAIVEPANSNVSADHIFCNGSLTNHADAYLYATGPNRKALHSYFQATTIYNYGKMIFEDLDYGMYLLAPFENYGDLFIEASNMGLYNRSDIKTYTASTNDIVGRVNCSSSSTWHHYGELEVNYITNTNTAAWILSGHFEIHNDAIVDISGSHKGMIVSSLGTFRNRGGFNISNDQMTTPTLQNEGFFVNHQKGVINSKGHYGVFNLTGAEVRNFGTWYMNELTSGSLATILNVGVFSNRPKGKLYLEGKMNLSQGNFNNQGHMFALDDVAHLSLVGFNNTGTLNDVHDRISGITNPSYRVHKISGPLTQGVPYSNFLDQGTNPGALVLNVYTTASGSVLAGTYNSSTNTFTPNANAVGLNSLFVRTRIITGGVTRRHELIVENGIQSNPSPLQSNIHPNPKSFTTTKVSLAPNPMQSEFTINVDLEDSEPLRFHIFNMMGQLESKGFISHRSQRIQLPEQMASGMYILRLSNTVGEILATKNLRVVR